MNRTPPIGFRVVPLPMLKGHDGFAAVQVAGPLKIVVSWAGGWDHVSASCIDRTPTWAEMETIARHFWPNETAMQLHVPAKDHIDCHPFVLHWWRPQGVRIPRPPQSFV